MSALTTAKANMGLYFPKMYSPFPTHHILTVVKTSSTELTTNFFLAQIVKNLAHIIKIFFDGVEAIVEKGENAGYQHFLLFH